ncbi:hypothetical protein GOBAR_AA39964 [Gossypium barbadense]|uniref:Uncharacterized protein n=1 Tax=Gossypium barbadense TaxID=3634 RepID=A0A2P5VPQ7_GOSBA|nr:hypothetical protein GOBAR_AA39964 [Gossypium barbadense]
MTHGLRQIAMAVLHHTVRATGVSQTMVKLHFNSSNKSAETQHTLNHHDRARQSWTPHGHFHGCAGGRVGTCSKIKMLNKLKENMGRSHGRPRKPCTILITRHGRIGSTTGVGKVNATLHGRAMRPCETHSLDTRIFHRTCAILT